MTVDKNLFLYNLSIVSIMKNEGPYAKEWIDYHLLAGVEHFYIYDNDSPDNLKEVLQPYINAGIVTYTFFPGEVMQCAAYNDALKKYRFLSRYIAFIDGDEFIFPQDNKNIPEVLEDIFSQFPNGSGLAINWHLYGSNFQEKADYSKGVLERFTRRCEKHYGNPLNNQGLDHGNAYTKTVTNPRAVDFFPDPHYPNYYAGLYRINEEGKPANTLSINYPITDNKICINHYVLKSREEYEKKIPRGDSYYSKNPRKKENFSHDNANDEFDDEILKYRAYRMSVGGGYNTAC